MIHMEGKPFQNEMEFKQYRIIQTEILAGRLITDRAISKLDLFTLKDDKAYTSFLFLN